MEVDVWIKNGFVYLDGTFEKKDVGIAGEKIAVYLEPGGEVQARQIIDAEGQYVIPGMIDFHTHIREPGVEEKED